MPAPAWSDWRPFPPGLLPRDARVLAELLDGGQAFRWQVQRDGTWLGQWSSCVVEVRGADGGWAWRAPRSLSAQASREIARYFGRAQAHAAQVDALPWRSDAHLARCLAAFPGLRILRQPFGETLLGFLCSATKQIVQIKQMLALLAGRHGVVVARVGARTFHRLPTWPELALVTESQLRACKLGFRARFIHQAAQFLAAHPGWLGETERLPYPEAKRRLCSLHGVGEKVADCVLLFGAGRLEAFPVDVWILRVMAARYGLQGWKPAQVAQFGRAHFGPFAGLAQQYLFAYERGPGRRQPSSIAQ